MTITTTLNAIKAHDPCASGWAVLLKSLDKSGPDDEPLSLTHILQSNGLDDAIWALRTLDESHRKTINLIAYRFADLARPYMKDQRSINALDITYRFINGEATLDEVRNAADAADAAARAAYAAAYAADAADAAARAASAAASAADAADAAARAAYAAASAADAADAAYAAYAAARAAAYAAARAAYAADAADAAYAAARAAYAAARAAVRKNMERIFLEFVE